MKKSVLSSLILFGGIFSISLSSFLIVQYDSKNNNEETAPAIIDKNSKAIVENYYQGTSSPYARFANLESALISASQSSQNVDVYLLSGSFLTEENKTLIVGDNTSLYLPYDELKNWNNTDVASLKDLFVDTSSAGVNTYRRSQLKLINTNLIVNGYMYIGGQFRTKGICSYYAEVSLDENSSITVNGSLYNYGYIKEINNKNVDNVESPSYSNEFDSNRYLKVTSTGYLRIPIGIYDMQAASIMYELINNNVCPVNVFDFYNTQTFLQIDSGGVFDAQCRAYLSTSVMSKAADVTGCIISNQQKASSSGSKPLFFLESGSISFEYCPINPDYTNADNSKTYITINGLVNMGYLYFDLELAEINTSYYFLPISYKLDIRLEGNTEFNFNYQVKFMGGSSLTISNSSTANILSKFIIYKTDSTNGITSYPIDKGDAKIINNGNMKVANSGSIGGNIETENSNGTAIIDLTDISQESLRVSSNEGLSNRNISINATGTFYNFSKNIYENYLLGAGELIYSDKNGLCCWANGYISSYILKIIIDNKNNYEHPTAGFRVWSYDSDGSNETLLTTEGILETSNKEFSIEIGKQIKIESSSRAERTYFSMQEGSNYTFVSNQMYIMLGNIDVTIEPGEGIEIWFVSAGMSGNATSNKYVYESETENGNYLKIADNEGGSKLSAIIRKGFYYKYEYKRGTGTAVVDNIFLYDGLLSITQNNYTEYSYEEVTASNKNNNTLISDNLYCDGEKTLYAHMTEGPMCLLPNSLITLSNGLTKYAKNLCKDDKILTYDHFTGQFEEQKLIANVILEENYYDIISLSFDNGKQLNVATGHGLFNVTTGKYEIYYGQEFKNHIGEEFISVDYNGSNFKLNTTKLISVEISYEKIAKVSPVSEYNINCIADGMLTIPDDIEGLFDAFKFSDLNNGLKINLDDFHDNVSKYGTYNYEDVEKVIPKYLFDVLNFKYFKTFIGMGVLTYDKVNYWISQYAKQMCDYNGIEWDWDNREYLSENN